MITQDEIRLRLSDVLNQRMSLGDFSNWLTQRSWNMHKDTPRHVQDLVWNITSPLYERGGEGVSDEMVMAALSHVLSELVGNVEQSINLGYAPKKLVATAASRVWRTRPPITRVPFRTIRPLVTSHSSALA